MTYDAIEVVPLTGALGAEVRGVDLSQSLSNRVKSQIHQAFLDHLMIFFRDQTLEPERHVEIARQFGKPAIYPFLKGLDSAPEINVLLKTEADTVNFGGVWHSDTAYKDCPDMGTLLYAHEVPLAGGDTLFANMYMAYEALSDGMKAMIDGLVAANNSDKSYIGGRAAGLRKLEGMKGDMKDRIDTLEAEHPVVRTHPETGRRSLYVNAAHTLRFKDMTQEESKPLIDYLCAHAVQPEFTCRLRWQPGTLAVWDNRCTQHFAVNDYSGHRRLMHRVTIEGDRPH
ncbi:MAG: TauD/TfdA family dioxygenase [Hyphomicrobiales bacterium]|nr:TauD/TfdA family dioxygenase [Hyphomicrobiales bacterium]